MYSRCCSYTVNRPFRPVSRAKIRVFGVGLYYCGYSDRWLCNVQYTGMQDTEWLLEVIALGDRIGSRDVEERF